MLGLVQTKHLCSRFSLTEPNQAYHEDNDLVEANPNQGYHEDGDLV